jgi:2-oxo-4-hydroxy-4-carboxy-5-ureidoimidazoline decarboxylase
VNAEPHVVLNAASEADAREALARCCGSIRWVERMLAARPFASSDALLSLADEIWNGLDSDDHLEAFRHHPQIGTNPAELARKFPDSASWAAQEQAGASGADSQTLSALRAENLTYAAHFGFIFIVCATGKSADEMLALLRARMPNHRATELRVAAAEQAKITKLRLEKLA